MTSTVIEGHKMSLYVYLNFNLRSYGQLFVLVFSKSLQSKDLGAFKRYLVVICRHPVNVYTPCKCVDNQKMCRHPVNV